MKFYKFDTNLWGILNLYKFCIINFIRSQKYTKQFSLCIRFDLVSNENAWIENLLSIQKSELRIEKVLKIVLETFTIERILA